MREIKLKVWSIKGNYFLNIQEDPDYTCCFNEKGALQLLNNGSPVKGLDYVLLLFTGLNDKNGEEIYEGDIMGGGVVKFVKELAAFKLMEPRWEHNMLYASNNYEVVGNIYENTEIL